MLSLTAIVASISEPLAYCGPPSASGFLYGMERLLSERCSGYFQRWIPFKKSEQKEVSRYPESVEWSLRVLEKLRAENPGLTGKELQEQVVSKGREILSEIPALPESLNWEALGKLPEGEFRIPFPPKVEWLMEAHSFADSNGELGFFKISDQWVMVVSHGKEVRLPLVLQYLDHAHLIRFDLHTHPGRNQLAQLPSLADLDASFRVGGSRDSYIATSNGWLHLKRPNANSLGSEVQRPEAYLRDWLAREHLTEADVQGDHGFAILDRFLKEVYSMRRISWDNSDEIQDLLQAQRSGH